MKATSRRAIALGILVSAALGLSACQGLLGPSNGATTSAADTSATAAASLCVDTINHYRTMVGLASLARWTDAEACANGQSQSDSASGIGHGSFTQCGEVAQNECPGWSGTTTSASNGCLGAMWNEGPGIGEAHAHYVTMSNTNYTMVACGFYTTATGLLWSVQDFK